MFENAVSSTFEFGKYPISCLSSDCKQRTVASRGDQAGFDMFELNIQKFLKGTILDGALPSLHEGTLKITLIIS